MRRMYIFITLLVFISGCGTWRGIPSHGGGKRFDEEQRVVACAIRKAVADMNVSELRGMKIQVHTDSLAQNGGGQLTFPGLASVSAGYNEIETDGRSNNIYSRDGWDTGASVKTDLDLKPTVFATDSDLKYFEATLNMKLLHSGVSITAKNPDCVLYVLVDVLGTNRSRNDSLIAWKDNLRATCELTYYALEPKNNGLFFSARRSCAESTYYEKSFLLLNNYQTGREMEAITPTYMPVDGNNTNLPVSIVTQPQPGPVIDSNEPEPSQFAKMRKMLEQKLQEANSYLQSGNLTAAEKTINDIRSIDPEFPGLDAVYSRLEAAKNQDPNN